MHTLSKKASFSLCMIACLLSITCATLTLADPLPPAATPQPSPAAATTPFKRIVFSGISPSPDAQVLSFVDPDGSKPHKTSLTVSLGSGGSIFHGGALPKVSSDGEWVAFLGMDDQIWIGSLNDTTKAQPITTIPKQEYPDFMLTGWAPNRPAFVFWIEQGMQGCDECNLPPLSLPTGFYLTTPPLWNLSPLPLKTFEQWSADGSSAINSITANDYGGPTKISTDVLTINPIDGSKPTPLFSSGLVSFTGDFTYHPDLGTVLVQTIAKKDGSGLICQVAHIPTDGKTSTPLSPTGGWCAFDAPAFSPDGRHVAYVQKTDATKTCDVIVHASGGTWDIISTEKAIGCDFAWVSPSHIVTLNNNELTRYDLTGDQLTLAKDVGWFSVAGQSH